jgi:hypothetical protein
MEKQHGKIVLKLLEAGARRAMHYTMHNKMHLSAEPCEEP